MKKWIIEFLKVIALSIGCLPIGVATNYVINLHFGNAWTPLFIAFFSLGSYFISLTVGFGFYLLYLQFENQFHGVQ